MKYLMVLLCVVVAASGTDYEISEYVVKREWIFRKKQQDPCNRVNPIHADTCRENRDKVARHNERYRLGLETFSLKLNEYSDMTHREFVSLMCGYKRTLQHGSLLRGATFIAPALLRLPREVDWRSKGAVTDVKDQQRCGSCWAFSATGSIEGQHFRKSRHLVSLSEQNLIDCSKQYGNNGCGGGNMELAYMYVRDNGGMDTEASYPYEGREGVCRFNETNSGAEVTGYTSIPAGDEQRLQAAVATAGPVSAAIDASQHSFHFYNRGVYYDARCSSENLNHGVLVVGYGTDKEGGDYWLVKNSWGRKWGDHGYIKMARNRENHCGIASSASFPLV